MLCVLQVPEADLEMHVVRVHAECHDGVTVPVQVDVLVTDDTTLEAITLVVHGRSLP